MSPAERQKMQTALQSDLQDVMEVCERWLDAFGRPKYEGHIPETERYEDLEETVAPKLNEVAKLMAEVEKEFQEWDRRSVDREAKLIAEEIRERQLQRAYDIWKAGV